MATPNEKSSGEMTFFEHIDALRPHLVRGAVVLFTVMVGAFLAKGLIIDTILMGPQKPDVPLNRLMAWLAEATGAQGLQINNKSFTMVNTSMAGQFNLHMKISFITAFAVAIPYLLWEIWQFVKPALTPGERRGSQMFVFYVSMCFFGGLLFGYFLIAPLTVNFLGGYTASADITNMIDVNSYLSTIANVSLACAAIFQLPILVYFLARMGVLKSDFMRRYRRHAILVLCVISAIITPPDVASLVLVALPFYLLYEYSIRIAARVERKKAEREAAEEAAFNNLPTTGDS